MKYINQFVKLLFAGLLLTNMVSCSSTKLTAPKISVNHDIQSIREGDVITLTTTGTKGAYYKWTGPNGQVNKDSTSNTWVINLIGDPTEYSGQYKVTEYMIKGNKVAAQAIDTLSLKVAALPLINKVSDTRFSFIRAGKYRVIVKDVDIRTTTLTGYMLCLDGDKCVSLDPNNSGPKCFDRPSGGNSFTVNCTGDCPFKIVRTELHGPGGETAIQDNAQDLANNILTFDDGKGFAIKLKVEAIR